MLRDVTRDAGIDGPAGALLAPPFPAQLLAGMVEAVGDDVDGVAGTAAAHGHVPQSAAATVLVTVGDIDR